MSNTEKNNTQSYLDRLKKQAISQENYGAEIKYNEAKVQVYDCPECAAARAPGDGLTVCAYCGYKFMTVKLSDGIHIKKVNNS